MKGTKLADYMDHVYNTDISVLTIISDEEYNKGIEMMEYRIRKAPEAILVTFCKDFFYCRKK